MNAPTLKQTLEVIKNHKKDGGNYLTIRKEIGEERLREFFKAIYPKFTITEIEKITGIPDSSLGYWFHKLKIPFTRHHAKTIAYSGDKDETGAVVTIGDKTYELVTIKITPELAYVIGFALGDGSISQYMVEVFNKDKALRKPLFEFLKPYGTITEQERANGLWRLRLSNGRVANLIKDQEGLRYDTLEYIFKNTELARKFIAGFWDAEGTVRAQGNYYHLYVYNSNEHLLDRITRFLEKKGIKCSKLSKEPAKGIRYLDGHRIISKKIVHRLSVSKNYAKKWIEEIGVHMFHAKKSNIVKQMIQMN